MDAEGWVVSLLKEFKEFYQDFSVGSLDQLKNIYSHEVIFRDPVHEIHGIEAFENYFSQLCRHLNYCKFEFDQEVVSENKAFYQWLMRFSHPGLRGGDNICVHGCSVIQFDTKVYCHEDFYDLGAMLYEHVPVLGRAVVWLKGRLATKL